MKNIIDICIGIIILAVSIYIIVKSFTKKNACGSCSSCPMHCNCKSLRKN